MTKAAGPAGTACADGLPLRELMAGSPLPRLETHMLWQAVLDVPRSWLIAHDDAVVDASQQDAYRRLAQRRLQGEPMAYILGYREFMGHRFRAGPQALIPRPETELLVEQGLRLIAGLPAPSVLDLGTGSGAIAISIALARPDASVVATDTSQDALGLARRNAQELGALLQFFAGNWYDSLLDALRFDLIVSNPPYVALGDPHLQQGDLRFEPPVALTDGADGLAAFRSIVAGAPAWLRPGGALCLEHGWNQAAAVGGLLQQHGFTDVVSVQDLAGIPRVTIGRLS